MNFINTCNTFLVDVTASGDAEQVLSNATEEVKKGNIGKAWDLIKGLFVALFERYGETVSNFCFRVIGALIIYFVGKKIVTWLSNIAEKALEKSRIEISVSKFLAKLAAIIMKLLLFIVIIGFLGIPTTSFVAILGTIGLAVGLSLQGSLSNFAGGVLILILKPFRVDDYIISNGLEGKVVAIDIFYTKMLTGDNKKISIPNGTLANSSIQNVPNEAVRRLDLSIPVEYDADIKQVRKVLLDIASENKQVRKDRDVNVFVDSLDDSAIAIGFRVWVATADYWQVRWDMLETIVERFREESISIPFNQLDVNINK